MANLTNSLKLIGQSHYFSSMLEHISKLASLNKPVLVIGERGTGKELVAQRLHYLSSRWQAPLIKLNCAAINENLLESELFGHESGAFSGAQKQHAGRFERAHGGSLFLDELANTSTSVQEKLLRVIEYGEYERVGGHKTLQANVRLIAATNEDLPNLTTQGRFRADLLDRLAFDVITIPPLRYRQEDILLLAEHFAINMASELKFDLFSGFSEDATQALLDYHWPGNVRELKNVIERSLYRAGNPNQALNEIVFDPFESPFRPVSTNISTNKSERPKPSPQINDLNSQNEAYNYKVSLKQASAELEINMIKNALKQSQYNQKQAAQLLQVSYHQLRGYLKKYKLLDSLKHD
ncbi:phage shock protein operon transcriptional activator [Catenovulum adriaticum]|uniref:Phage shock protein operon transcriptional activator n=1 Tax=Catenovulum adriaticum TaxID=2984846 RepID=A0ABY7AJ92_9ALTE|nr:phage shock protein operon transcriptional activator [Catenovulum sp. TS8]WAJ69637.1 phage shock protein operon transcriptional activator [Catenovulum sp. TS8]